MATQDDYIRTALRVPPDLHAQLHEAAKVNNRTFNAEIVARLQASFDPLSTTLDVIHQKGMQEAIVKALETFVLPTVRAEIEATREQLAAMPNVPGRMKVVIDRVDGPSEVGYLVDEDGQLTFRRADQVEDAGEKKRPPGRKR